MNRRQAKKNITRKFEKVFGKKNIKKAKKTNKIYESKIKVFEVEQNIEKIIISDEMEKMKGDKNDFNNN